MLDVKRGLKTLKPSSQCFSQEEKELQQDFYENTNTSAANCAYPKQKMAESFYKSSLCASAFCHAQETEATTVMPHCSQHIF